MEELNLKIERYEGPLDLLLALIAKNKLNIFDIPIAEIAEQYMAHIEAMRSLNMEVTSEFIYYAAELMLIKSRMLLPREEEEDPRRNLVDALLEYRRARAAAELLRERGELYYDRFTKAPDEIEAAYERPHAVSLLAEAFERIRARLADKPSRARWSCSPKSGRSATTPWRRSPSRCSGGSAAGGARRFWRCSTAAAAAARPWPCSSPCSSWCATDAWTWKKPRGTNCF